MKDSEWNQRGYKCILEESSEHKQTFIQPPQLQAHTSAT
jgi:hypothetical protein